MQIVYCQMLGDGIPVEVCHEEQGQRGCKTCKAPTRKCEKCRRNPAAPATPGLCESCASPREEPVVVMTVVEPTVADAQPTVVASPPPTRLTLLDKIRGVREHQRKPRSPAARSAHSSGTTYGVADGLRFVIYLTPVEFAVWNWVVSERRVDDPTSEVMLPAGPRALRRNETQEPISCTMEEYWATVFKFQQHGLLEHVRTVGERLSFYRVLFNPVKYHVVRIAKRVMLGLKPLQWELIAAVQADELDIPGYDEVASDIKEWIQERFPVLDPIHMRAKLVGFVHSRSYQSWGTLYLHGASRRCLVCKKGFEPYDFYIDDAVPVSPDVAPTEPPPP